jgi:rhamnogalacturonan endolyase
MTKQRILRLLIALFVVYCLSGSVEAARYMENLDRGLVAVHKGGSQVYIGWRMFGTEPATVGYNVYRGTVKLNASPITNSTNYIDNGGSLSSTYRVAAVNGGVEQELSDPVTVWDSFCRSITLAPINGSYSPNDASVGDLDGDGQYEIVIKRLSTDISQTSTTFHVIEAYRLGGTFLWRINLGPNNLYAPEEINPMVYDFDGDGRAEVALRTCEGNVDGIGVTIGDTDGDGKTDYRDTVATPGEDQWFMTEGPEFLSVFDGLTGREITRTNYIERDPLSQWGSSGMSTGQYAHRANKCMMTPAYVDGQRPSLVICRGIYHRIKMEAWNFRDGSLSKVWSFDTANWPGYAGQGNHNLTVGDVDSDGKDEIVYASMCVDDDGSGLYTTGLGHGDALHMSDMIPDRPGLEVFQCHEVSPYGTTLRDAGTGEILWQQTAGGDTGRCCAAHVDYRYPGYQMWSVATDGTYNATDKAKISENKPNWGNFLAWWDGDLQREILDDISGHNNPYINKWWNDGAYRLLSLYNVPTDYGTKSNNGTKGNPCLSGDILGDWREEMIYRSTDNTKLRIFTTTDVTSHRIYTLMHDSQYRTAIAWQCNMYNQPPHPSFYIGEGMSPPPQPDIILVGGNPDETIPPTPDPMGWEAAPYVSGNGSIAMEAVAALDSNGVEYYFACTYGGGHDSGWQNGTIYEDSGLTAGQTYTYTVTARDKSTHRNTTRTSVPASCMAETITGLVYWDFEDGAAGTAFSGMPGGGSVDAVNGIVMYGYDATYGPSFSFETATGTGLSAYCNGSQDGYTTDASLNGWSPQAWTIEVSVHLLDISGWRTIIGRDGSSQSDAESDFYLQNNGIDNKFRINIDTVGGQRWILDGDYVPVASTWYRLAVTSDGITLKMYLDDGGGYTQIGTLDISAQSVTNNALAQGGYNWTFGRGWYDGDFTDHVNGYIDDIRFSEQVLLPAEFLGVLSESIPWLYGDFTGNHFVNFDDFAVFSELWLRQECESLRQFDQNADCLLSLQELLKIADNWLTSQ